MKLEREKVLIERANTSSDAFGELYDTYYEQIFGYALKRTADVESARDITAATFFKALRGIKNYRWKGIPFSHWLYRIANREIIDRHRKSIHETSFENSENRKILQLELSSGEAELRRYESYLEIHDYVSRLPSKYEEVISLKYFEDMDIKQISSITGKPEGTIKSMLHRSIDLLRKMME